MSSAARRLNASGISHYAHGADAPLRATAQALDRIDGARSLILVEGVTDQIALETLAERQGRDLSVHGNVIVPIGGATAIGAFVERFGGGDLRLAGLCDAAERAFYERALSPEGNAVFVCDTDLEDELLRATGTDRVLELIDAEGEGRSFRTLQKQAPWVDAPVESQLRRWIGSRSRRKSRYARLLTEAAPEERIPAPLLDVLDWAEGRVTPHL